MADATEWNDDDGWVDHLPFQDNVQSDAVADKFEDEGKGEDNDEDIFYEDEGDEASKVAVKEESSVEIHRDDDDNTKTNAIVPTLSAIPAARIADSKKAVRKSTMPTHPLRQSKTAMTKPTPLKRKSVPSKSSSTVEKDSNTKNNVVSRREDAAWLIALATLYFLLGLLCFVAYGVKGKKWYGSTANTLTTVLAILGVSFSLLNKFTTTCLTTAYRREVGADLLSRKGLTLQDLLHFDQFVNRSTMSLLGSKGFRTITMPVGICIIVASAIMKKSFELTLAKSPIDRHSEQVHSLALIQAPNLLPSHSTWGGTVNLPYSPTMIFANMSYNILQELGATNIFVSPYGFNQFDDNGIALKSENGNGDEQKLPIKGALYGTPALPDTVFKQTPYITHVYALNSPVLMARQMEISDILWEQSSMIGSRGYSVNYTLSDPNSLSAGVTIYLYNNTLALGYYETVSSQENPVYAAEFAFQLNTAYANTLFLSTGIGDYVTNGQQVITPFNDTTLVPMTTTDEILQRAANTAGELVTVVIKNFEATSATSADESTQEDIEREINSIAASLALVYMTNYEDEKILNLISGNKTVTVAVLADKMTLIFGRDHYTLALGVLLCIISFSVAAWSFKSMRKPIGFEFKLISAMSLVANAIDPNTELTQAISQMERESKRQEQMIRRPFRKTTSAIKRTKSEAGKDPSTIDPEKGSNQRQGIKRPNTQAKNSGSQSYINPANIRLGLDIATRLIRLADDGDGDV